jgi:low temperature requirement protein LtrA
VTFIELFFDLVFVFAITQLSHRLLAHFTPWGIAETALLTFAVWWVWIYTSWITNWLDPNAAPVRLMLLVLMLLGLIMSTSIPQAFEARALTFAGAYVLMQVGRSLFMMQAAKSHSRVTYQNFQRITVWLVASGIFWIAGAFVEKMRFGLWLLAIVMEFISPALGFWVPGLGRSVTADWDVEGGHLAERCGLFVIISHRRHL